MNITTKDLRQLQTPHKIQLYINNLHYNNGKRISIATVYEEQKADCLEAACFAAYLLSLKSIEHYIMDLSAIRDEDHVLCVFKQQGLYGAIGKSKYAGLRYRNPVYKTPRELAMSYFENYFNYFGEYTLRSHSPLFTVDFSTTLQDVKAILAIEQTLIACKHHQLVPEHIKLPRVTKEKFAREVVVRPTGTRIGKEYDHHQKL